MDPIIIFIPFLGSIAAISRVCECLLTSTLITERLKGEYIKRIWRWDYYSKYKFREELLSGK